jgi:hypothetical protein
LAFVIGTTLLFTGVRVLGVHEVLKLRKTEPRFFINASDVGVLRQLEQVGFVFVELAHTFYMHIGMTLREILGMICMISLRSTQFRSLTKPL